MATFERVIWIVLDSVGIGALPDAGEYGDIGRNTLGHIAESRPLQLPNLVQRSDWPTSRRSSTCAACQLRAACYGKGATHSPGKDTTTGHWEMAGHLAAAGVSGLQAGISAGSDRAVRARSAERRSATSPPPAQKSSRNWAKSTCAPGIRSCTRRATAFFRLPRTKR